jgi:hypothetical protein
VGGGPRPVLGSDPAAGRLAAAAALLGWAGENPAVRLPRVAGVVPLLTEGACGPAGRGAFRRHARAGPAPGRRRCGGGPAAGTGAHPADGGRAGRPGASRAGVPVLRTGRPVGRPDGRPGGRRTPARGKTSCSPPRPPTGPRPTATSPPPTGSTGTRETTPRRWPAPSGPATGPRPGCRGWPSGFPTRRRGAVGPARRLTTRRWHGSATPGTGGTSWRPPWPRPPLGRRRGGTGGLNSGG